MLINAKLGGGIGNYHDGPPHGLEWRAKRKAWAGTCHTPGSPYYVQTHIGKGDGQKQEERDGVLIGAVELVR